MAQRNNVFLHSEVLCNAMGSQLFGIKIALRLEKSNNSQNYLIQYTNTANLHIYKENNDAPH